MGLQGVFDQDSGGVDLTEGRVGEDASALTMLQAGRKGRKEENRVGFIGSVKGLASRLGHHLQCNVMLLTLTVCAVPLIDNNN